MPLFRFHFVCPPRLVYDDQGAELGSLRDAYLRASELVLHATCLLHQVETARWRIDISDNAGTTLVTVLFPSVRRRPNPGYERKPLSLGPTVDTPSLLRGYAAALRSIRSERREDHPA